MNYEERNAIREAYQAVCEVLTYPEMAEQAARRDLEGVLGLLALALGDLDRDGLPPGPLAGQVWRDPATGAELHILGAFADKEDRDLYQVVYAAYQAPAPWFSVNARLRSTWTDDRYVPKTWPILPFLHLVAGRGAPWEPSASWLNDHHRQLAKAGADEGSDAVD